MASPRKEVKMEAESKAILQTYLETLSNQQNSEATTTVIAGINSYICCLI